MRKKKFHKIGFSIARLNVNTIEIEGIPDKSLTPKKRREAFEKYSNVSIYLFPEDYIEKLNSIENEIEEKNNDRKYSLKKSMRVLADALMK